MRPKKKVAQTKNKVELTPTQLNIMARARAKKEALPEDTPYDAYGYVSPRLQQYRQNPSRLSTEERDFMANIERKRRENYDAPIRVDTPLRIQPNGLPSAAYRHMNPANIRGANQTEGFIHFPSRIAGVQELEHQIRLDARRGLTTEEFTYKFAPPTENDTELYLRQLMAAAGVNRDTPISQIPLSVLTDAVVRKESGTRITRQSRGFRGAGGGGKF